MGEDEIIRRAYAAFNRRDLEEATSLMAANVEWPNGREGGIERGREAVKAYWTRQWGVIDPHVEPLSIERDGAGRWVVEVHQVVRDLEGRVLVDQAIRHMYELKDGLIARMTIEEGR